VQEARYEAAMKDLNKAQDQLDEKEKELEAVQAQYDQAMSEKQVTVQLFFTARRICRVRYSAMVGYPFICANKLVFTFVPTNLRTPAPAIKRSFFGESAKKSLSTLIPRTTTYL